MTKALLKSSSVFSRVTLSAAIPSETELLVDIQLNDEEALRTSFDHLILETRSIIDSYHISDLLLDYVKGARQWLYNELITWMDSEPLTSASATKTLLPLILVVIVCLS